MFDAFKKIDWKLQGAVGMLMAIGLVSLLSSHRDLFWRQLMWIGIGTLFFSFLVVIDLRSFFSHRGVLNVLYVGLLGLLVVTRFIAPNINGNRSWILIGPFQFEPSEIAKLLLVLMLAFFFSKQHIGIARWKTVLTSFMYVAIPGILIALLPDMGSALILFGIWFGFILVSGIPMRKLAITIGAFMLLLFFMWTSVLKPYQKDRIVGLFQPQQDPLGISYNVIQAKIAIGSGGIFGEGFGQGTQVQLGFLPEAQTDFIFSAIAQEGGMFAVIILLGGFLWMILRLLKMGYLLDTNFGKLVCLGTAIFFVTQFVFNVGSNLGLFPVVGVTFPFVSYGGSSMIINLILVGIVQSLYAKR